jgi:putative hydrolase of the HAD superfamily
LKVFLRKTSKKGNIMKNNIEAIFLDVGNTLRVVVEDEAFQAQSKRQLVDLTGAQMSPDEFFDLLEERYKVLRKRAKEQLIEASEKEMWTQWMLPDFPAEKIAPLSSKLTRLWRDSDGRRVARPDVKDTVIELHKRGYILGIIANTITETEIPDWIVEDGLTGYFQEVVLSSKVGYRKPGPEIYWEAAKRIGVEPEHCVYVGDNPVRDVEGARKAGYGMMIVLYEPATFKKEPQTGEYKADYTIQNLSELLDIFPERELVDVKS